MPSCIQDSEMKRIFTLLSLIVVLCFGNVLVPQGIDCFTFEIAAKTKKSSSKKRTSSKSGSKKSVSSKSKKKKTGSKKRKVVSPVTVVLNDTNTGEWIHRGRKGIVIHKDTTGTVRAMNPFTMSASAGEEYAGVLNEFADSLKKEEVKLYSLIAPTQGEFYMPDFITENLSQEKAIEKWARYLRNVRPVFVCSQLRNHTEEEIYNRTDHHWSPLGAYYASQTLASDLHLDFLPLDEYEPAVVHDYVGTMYKFSGDKEILNYPEDFVYYVPPGDYVAEFIDYTYTNGRTTGESEIHEAPLLRNFPDGSGAAYSTFLGGDNHTVKIVNRNDKSGRKALIVKDSYGNAMVPCLVNSFDELHVIDFRYFPHSLLGYVRDNGITDLIFVNCVELAFASHTPAQLKKIM